MKSNVKAALAPPLTVIGALAACKTSADADGLVSVPMLDSVPSATVASIDAGVDAGSHRPTVEPRAPQGQSCTRDVHCIDALATAPTWPFAPPYDKCNPTPLGEAGKFSPQETSLKRSEDPATCCYIAFVGCSTRRAGGRGQIHSRPVIGRPLRDDHGGEITGPVAMDERARFWLEGAALEHASVAEFARLSLVLMAHGAPPELLAETHRAALDEIRHAETCFAIAGKITGKTHVAGDLEIARASTDASIEALARWTLRDGCLGETAAAMELDVLAAETEDEDVATALAGMARDEHRHAELAWRILELAIEKDANAAWRAIDEEELFTRTPLEQRVVREIVLPRLSELAKRRSPREGGCAREA